MATLLILKRRIKTASNISKTTKAMQMIAASKLKRAQESAESSKPYVQKLDYLSKAIEQRVNKEDMHEYMLTKQNINAKLLIVISPDKGLSGGLVTNLVREILRFSANGKIYYLTIGKKAEKVVASLNKEIVASFPFGTSLPSYEAVFSIAKLVDEYFLGNKVSEVKILTTRFNSVFSQAPSLTTLLPVRLEEEKIEDTSKTVFEPKVSELLPGLLRHYLEMVIYQSLLDSFASEQASRMIAMKNATDNALDIIEELQLEYNKTRQEKITNELLDIGGSLEII